MPPLCQGAFANLSANSVISSSQVRLSQKAQAASRRSWASSASSQLQVQGVAGSLAFIFGIELAKLFDINPILVAVSLFLESNQAQESRPCQAGNRLTQSCLSWLSRGNSRGGLRSFHLRGGRSRPACAFATHAGSAHFICGEGEAGRHYSMTSKMLVAPAAFVLFCGATFSLAFGDPSNPGVGPQTGHSGSIGNSSAVLGSPAGGNQSGSGNQWSNRGGSGNQASNAAGSGNQWANQSGSGNQWSNQSGSGNQGSNQSGSGNQWANKSGSGNQAGAGQPQKPASGAKVPGGGG